MTDKPDLYETLDEITRRLAAAVPGNLRAAGEDLETRFRSVLTTAFERMDLVTREEFEIQTQVLLRTREKLEALEKRLESGRDDAA